MTVRTVLTRLFRSDEPTVVVECRRCGTAVAPGGDSCPECGGDELSRYEIPN